MSFGIAMSQCLFKEGENTKAKDINSSMLEGRSYGLSGSTPLKWKGMQIDIDSSYAPNVGNDGVQDGSWITNGINGSIGLKKKNFITESAYKSMIQETSRAIHLSPQKADEYLNNEYFNK